MRLAIKKSASINNARPLFWSRTRTNGYTNCSMQAQETAKVSWTTTFVLVISPLALAEMPSVD